MGRIVKEKIEAKRKPDFFSKVFFLKEKVL